jgi:hypothetical protein
LCGKKLKRLKAYSPNKVIAVKEYHKKKETEEAKNTKAKEAKKIQRATNALENKHLKKEKKV